MRPFLKRPLRSLYRISACELVTYPVLGLCWVDAARVSDLIGQKSPCSEVQLRSLVERRLAWPRWRWAPSLMTSARQIACPEASFARIVGSPRECETTGDASDIAAGWAWYVEDAVHHLRSVSVEIAGSAGSATRTLTVRCVTCWTSRIRLSGCCLRPAA